MQAWKHFVFSSGTASAEGGSSNIFGLAPVSAMHLAKWPDGLPACTNESDRHFQLRMYKSEWIFWSWILIIKDEKRKGNFSGKQSVTHKHRGNDEREKNNIVEHCLTVDLLLVTDKNFNASFFYITRPPFNIFSLDLFLFHIRCSGRKITM